MSGNQTGELEGSNGPNERNDCSRRRPFKTRRRSILVTLAIFILFVNGLFLLYEFVGINARSIENAAIARALLESNSRYHFKDEVVRFGGSTIHRLGEQTALHIDESLHEAAERSKIPVNYLTAHVFHESTGDPKAEFRNLKQWNIAKDDRERFAAADHGLVQISGRNLLKMFPDLSPASLKAKAEDIDFAINFLADTVSSDLKWASEQDIDALAQVDKRVVTKAKNPFWLAALAYNRGRPGALEAIGNPRACRHADFVIAAWNHIDSKNGPDRTNSISAPTFPPEAADDPRTLAVGDDGPRVEALQDLLNARMTPSPLLKTDGRFGPATRDALIKFQRSHKLEPTGVTDPTTWEALLGLNLTEASDSPEPLTMGDQGPKVESLQTLLNDRLAPDPLLTVDGRFGAATRNVLVGFQRSHKLEPTGAADAPTWEALKATDRPRSDQPGRDK
jgi:peptidoglycan hydrolase-like protein with peptidoglycan-binding domain